MGRRDKKWLTAHSGTFIEARPLFWGLLSQGKTPCLCSTVAHLKLYIKGVVGEMKMTNLAFCRNHHDSRNMCRRATVNYLEMRVGAS